MNTMNSMNTMSYRCGNNMRPGNYRNCSNMNSRSSHYRHCVCHYRSRMSHYVRSSNNCRGGNMRNYRSGDISSRDGGDGEGDDYL